MAKIIELDQNTVNQIAAGEVVERPMSVVKELVENAIDAGAAAITVEIKDGGTSMIRVTDNGSGIERKEITNAFRAHATSKLFDITDIYRLTTLGFRGEALSSIAAVSKIELITRTRDELSGTRVILEGGEETLREEVGAPAGTTVIVRELFYNTPARRKFLKSPQTEGSYVAELMERLSMDEPNVSMNFISNGSERFTTSGNGDLKELIYRIYGRDVATSLVSINAEKDDLRLEGYLGEPALNRSNRNFELFFVNGRYVKNKTLSKALEEGYKQYLMQHKFPFAVIHLRIPSGEVDVNVHPTKLDVRFTNEPELFSFIKDSVALTLHDREMMPRVSLDDNEVPQPSYTASAGPKENIAPDNTGDRPDPLSRIEKNTKDSMVKPFVPEPFEESALTDGKLMEPEAVYATGISPKPVRIEDARDNPIWKKLNQDGSVFESQTEHKGGIIKNQNAVIVEKGIQLGLFDDEKVLSEKNRRQYNVLGQIFGTYWLIGFKDKLMIMDQHAAHEKVNYERMIKRYEADDMASQLVSPPAIVTLSAAEEQVFISYRSFFEKLGFNIENFGGREYAMRAVPVDLYGTSDEKEMFHEILDELGREDFPERTPDVINYRIAGMACKASVKGSSRMSVPEVEKLLDELLTLDNPYNCPHGRPTLITMSQYELDRKFKRIVS